ncbi:MAG: adenosylcobinamide-GDP ribazoletransferase [Streptosporangiales bacterium]|nr:adenosylcobinamide-GDP ribazoletransferase [Streptosporangiales bacterium]
MRLSLGLLTIVPVRSPRPDRRVAGRAIVWAPAVGLMLGLAAAAVLVLADRGANLGSLLPAALAVATLALLTRGLHLDGLADLADGLGGGRRADEALRVMKNSDIGPFGVVTLVLVIVIQVAALERATSLGHGATAVVVAAVTGRLAATWGCRAGVPAARRDGLGALVAGTIRLPVAVILTAGALAAAVPFGVVSAFAVVVGLLAAAGLQYHAVRRLGGITGDVLGGLVEVATTAALVVMATGIGWALVPVAR